MSVPPTLFPICTLRLSTRTFLPPDATQSSSSVQTTLRTAGTEISRFAFASVPRPPAKKRCIHRKQIPPPESLDRAARFHRVIYHRAPCSGSQGSALTDSSSRHSFCSPFSSSFPLQRWRPRHSLCPPSPTCPRYPPLNLFSRNLPALVTSESGGGVCVIS